jgi:cystathionine beta-synthase
MTDFDVNDPDNYDRVVGRHVDLATTRRVHRDARGREVAADMLEVMGDTPMMALSRFSDPDGPTLLAKLEMLNPGGSVKDRIGITLIEAAEASGDLRPGGTIVEPTSGNTGVGLAIAAALKGYRCIFVVPDKVSDDKISLMRAYGAEVVVCPTAVEPEDPRSYYQVSDRLAARPNHFKPNQYFNMANPLTHVFSTAPEIWRQTNGEIDAFVCGVGTGGTATGVGRWLKERDPSITIVGADPEGSLYSGDEVHPYLVEGIGEDFWPPTFDRDVVDVWYRVSDEDSFEAARRCTREEGLLVGGSCGTALWAAQEYAKGQPADATIVVLLPDSGRGYLSKLYDDNWMVEHGFLDRSGRTIGAALASKSDDLPALIHVHPDETVADAIAILKEFGVSQMPVFAPDVHDDATMADVLGSIRENALLDLAVADPEVMGRPVGEVMQPPLPTITADEKVDEVMDRLTGADSALIIVEDDRPTGVLTRTDLLGWLAGLR